MSCGCRIVPPLPFVPFVLALACPALHAQEAPPAPPPPPDVVERPSNVVPLKASAPWWENAAFDRRVTLVVRDADLNAVTDALAKSSGMSLVVSGGGSRSKKKVSLNLKNAPLRDVMLAIANLYSLTWFRTGEVYTLSYISKSRSTSGGYTPSYYRRPALPKLSGQGASVTLPDGTRVLTRTPRTRSPRFYKPKTYTYTPSRK